MKFSIKKALLLVLTLVLVVLGLSATSTVSASGDYFTLYVAGPGICSNNSISYPIGGSGYFSSAWSLNASQYVNGAFVSTWTNSPIPAGPFVPDPNGVNVQPFSANMPYTYRQVWFAVENGAVIGQVDFTFSCVNGVLTLVNGPAGPAIPAGFVLRQILCTVTVYDAAGGIPIAGAIIKNGQTWFVNPKSVTAGKGEAWTEIFVSGALNGFIPTACVGSAPAGY